MKGGGWARLIGWGVCAVVLWFVIRALWRQFHEVQWSQVDVKPLPAIAATVCVIGVSAMQLVARTQARFKVEFTLRNVFERQTLAGMAEIIEGLLWSRTHRGQAAAGKREVVAV